MFCARRLRAGNPSLAIDHGHTAVLPRDALLLAGDTDKVAKRRDRARGALPAMPDSSAKCLPLAGGFDALPAPGHFTGTLDMDISGGGGMALELLRRTGREPRGIAVRRATLSASGHARRRGGAHLSVPSGNYVPTVRRGDTWLTPDYMHVMANRPGAGRSLGDQL